MIAGCSPAPTMIAGCVPDVTNPVVLGTQTVIMAVAEEPPPGN